MIRVYILSPTPMARAGLRTILEDSGAMVVGEGDGSAMPDLAEADVILVDGDGLLKEVMDIAMGAGAQALVVVSETDRPVRTLQALPLRGWGSWRPMPRQRNLKPRSPRWARAS